MRRLGAIWLVFGVCVALAVGAMAWVGSTALALERAEAKARRQAGLEESLQLALWRMDSVLAPLIAEEMPAPTSPTARCTLPSGPSRGCSPRSRKGTSSCRRPC